MVLVALVWRHLKQDSNATSASFGFFMFLVTMKSVDYEEKKVFRIGVRCKGYCSLLLLGELLGFFGNLPIFNLLSLLDLARKYTARKVCSMVSYFQNYRGRTC